jgi:hypothetical protein
MRQDYYKWLAISQANLVKDELINRGICTRNGFMFFNDYAITPLNIDDRLMMIFAYIKYINMCMRVNVHPLIFKTNAQALSYQFLVGYMYFGNHSGFARDWLIKIVKEPAFQIFPGFYTSNLIDDFYTHYSIKRSCVVAFIRTVAPQKLVLSHSLLENDKESLSYLFKNIKSTFNKKVPNFEWNYLLKDIFTYIYPKEFVNENIKN